MKQKQTKKRLSIIKRLTNNLNKKYITNKDDRYHKLNSRNSFNELTNNKVWHVKVPTIKPITIIILKRIFRKKWTCYSKELYFNI